MMQETTIAMLPIRDKNKLASILNEDVFALLGSAVSLREFKRAMESLAKNELYISSKLSKSLLLELSNLKNMQHDHLLSPVLTHRENEIAVLIAKGLPTSDISGKLNLSIQTVGTHRKHILKKLGLKNAAALSNYFFNQHKK